MSAVGKKPQRTCLGCREVKDQDELIRFVRSPDGEILADLKGRLPGRGAYLCNSRACIAAAVRNRQFDRSFRQACSTVDAAQLQAGLAQAWLNRLVALLGMSKKSAQFIAGSNAVLEALTRQTKLAVIVVAADISQQIGGKIRQKAAARQVPVAELFDKMELGRILGRAERSVVALPESKLADTFRHDLYRYQQISGDN
ncbi:MAG: DUF448 domain-containing protein [Desulfuromonadales bacterium]